MRRLTIEAAHAQASKNKGRCLSPEYKNSKTKLLWECAKGHRWKAVLQSISLLDSWCPKCSSLELHDRLRAKRLAQAKITLNEIAKQRGGQWLRGDFRGDKHKLTWRCASGHEWKAEPVTIKLGRWCPQCSTGRGERLVRLACEHIFRGKFIKTKPDWLVNSRGRKMELDGYNKKLKIAFEHQGEQHYESNFFNETKGNLKQRKKDDFTKKIKCRHNGVALMIVPEVGSQLKVENLETFVRAWASKNFPELKLNTDKVNYHDAYAFDGGQVALKELQEIALKRGGKCLETVYKGSQTKHRYRCGQGHEWSAKPNETKNQGQWCFKCAVVARDTWRKPIQKIQELAVKRGGLLLTKESLGSKVKHEWQCENGHRWMASPQNIVAGRWCPICRLWTQDDLKQLARAKGGKLLSKDFAGAKEKLLWQCKKGHKWSATGHGVARGSWCPTCAGQPTISIIDMKELATSHGGVCLSTEYISAKDKLSWRCSQGHEWKAMPSSIRNGKSWCRICFLARLRKIPRIKPVSHLMKLAQKRGGKILSTKNMGSKVKHEWMCAKGHKWMSKPTVIQQGYWCPQCTKIK